jgi:glycosyltransferase involved in cell wall biosynthesis
VNRGFHDFEWKIIGLNGNDKLLKHFEKKLEINHQSINVKCLGRKNASELKSIMLSADIFVHPSYIDNSPNSVCEAQILGIPVIASNVGGLNSIIEDNETGILVPSNGAFEISGIILKSYSNKDYFKDISINSQHLAFKRHNKEKILKDLLKVYQTILN